jgi:hypothetical protein
MRFVVGGYFDGIEKRFEETQTGIIWNTPDGKIPLDVPVCGMENELCEQIQRDHLKWMFTGVTVFTIVLLILFGVLYRKYQNEKILASEWWRIEWAQIDFSSCGLDEGGMKVDGISKMSIDDIRFGLNFGIIFLN